MRIPGSIAGGGVPIGAGRRVGGAGHPLLLAVQPLAEALGAEVVGGEAVMAGDLPLEWDGSVVGGFRLPGLHGHLERMLAAVEREHGVPLRDLPREAKQQVVRSLDERGAFLFRKAVEEVAEAIGVSRFTVYNYLNAAVLPPSGAPDQVRDADRAR